MSDDQEREAARLYELLGELERLEEEHRTLNLRDSHAVDEHARKIAELRRKIEAMST